MADSPPRRRRAASAAVQDALAYLPLEVLDNIFSRLHIYDVVRTSLLSRAWRRRWESLPTVDLSHSPGICASDIDALLLRRGSAPVRAFRLPARDPTWVIWNYFHDWLLCLSRRGVWNLTLSFPSQLGLFRLHSCLFSCRELTRLSLTSCRIPPAPAGLAGFPNLKTLRLENVSVCAQEHAGREFAVLIAASPVLEDVELVCVRLNGDGPDDEWVIRAPNLRKLSIVGPFKYGGITERLPLLKEVIFFGLNCAKFLTGMVGITKLDFSFTSILATEVDVLEQLPFLFENLRFLSVKVNFCKMCHIFSMFSLLRSAPVLEELEVWGWSDGTQEIETDSNFLNAQCADHIFAKLHVFHMKKCTYLINEMHFMEFVLSKARLLQVLYVTLDSYATCSNEEVVTEIAEYPRASSDAQVIFTGREPESSNDECRGFITACSEDDEVSPDKARPRRRHRLKSESVAQVEQLREELQNLENEREQVAKDRERLNKEGLVLNKGLVKYSNYFKSALQLLHEAHNMCSWHPNVQPLVHHHLMIRALPNKEALQRILPLMILVRILQKTMPTLAMFMWILQMISSTVLLMPQNLQKTHESMTSISSNLLNQLDVHQILAKQEILTSNSLANQLDINSNLASYPSPRANMCVSTLLGIDACKLER